MAIFLSLVVSSANAQSGYPGSGYPGSGYPGGGYPGGGYPGGGYPGSGYPATGGWVPSTSGGAPLPYSDGAVNSDGSANLMPSGQTPTMSNTYPIPSGAASWWYQAFSPNIYSSQFDPELPNSSLILNGSASNTVIDPNDYLRPFYDQSPDWNRPDNLPLPPQLLGRAQGDNTDTLTAYFVWTGDPAHIPPHADFLLRTRVSASASVNYGDGGATSGVSATATAALGPDSVTAKAGDAGSSSPAPLSRATLIQAVPVGNLITLSRVGSVSTDTSDGLPYRTWDDVTAPAGSVGTYYYNGHHNDYTGASAYANVSAQANTDSRYADIRCPLIETSYYKNPYPDAIGTPFRAPHIRRDDGAITTDSAVVWSDLGQCWSPVSPGPGSTSGVVPFNANAPGFNSPTYSWTLSGDGILNNGIGYPEQVGVLLTSPTTDGYPKGSTLSLTVTDSDNVTATNTFGVTWHIPYEKNTYLGSVKTKHPIATILEGIAPNQSHGTTFNKGGSLDMSGAIDGIGILLKMYNPEAEIAVGLVELLGKIATMTKWEYEYADDQTVMVKNEDAIWNDAVWDQNLPYQGDANIPPSLIGNIANRNLCNLTVKRVEEDNDESWYADGYNINGFDGNTKHLVKSHKIDNVFDQYYFEPFTNSTGGQP